MISTEQYVELMALSRQTLETAQRVENLLMSHGSSINLLPGIDKNVSSNTDAIDDLANAPLSDQIDKMLHRHGFADRAVHGAVLQCLYSLAKGGYTRMTLEEAEAIVVAHPRLKDFALTLGLSSDAAYPRTQLIAIAYVASINGLPKLFEEFVFAYDADEANAATQLRELVAADENIIRGRKRFIFFVAHAFNSFQIGADADFDRAAGTRMRNWNENTLFGR